MQLQDNTPIEFPARSGIYAIINIITDKHYIGSAVNLKMRRRVHTNELKRNDHGNSKLQNAWNKYWDFDFIFVILEYCEKDKQILLSREQWWIDTLKPEYNINPNASSRLGTKQSPETCAKMRANQNRSELTRYRKSVSHLGKKQSAQHVANMVEGKKGYKHSEETKKKIGEANRIALKGRKHTEETKEKMRISGLRRYGKS